jgi:hypothetical protein
MRFGGFSNDLKLADDRILPMRSRREDFRPTAEYSSILAMESRICSK